MYMKGLRQNRASVTWEATRRNGNRARLRPNYGSGILSVSFDELGPAGTRTAWVGTKRESQRS